MNEKIFNHLTPTPNHQMRLKNIPEIIEFIRYYQDFFEASFSAKSGFSRWVKKELSKTDKSSADMLKTFSSEFITLLSNKNLATDIRKDDKKLAYYQDSAACFMDSIVGIHYENSGNYLLETFLEESEPSISEYLYTGLLKIEPAIVKWYKFQNKNNSNKNVTTSNSSSTKITTAMNIMATSSPGGKSDLPSTQKCSVNFLLNTSNVDMMDTLDHEASVFYKYHLDTSDCLVINDNDINGSINETKIKLKNTSSLAQLTAHSMQALFSQAEHPNTYQELAKEEALSSPHGKKRLRLEDTKQVQKENTEFNCQGIDNNEDLEKTPIKRQKVFGRFSG